MRTAQRIGIFHAEYRTTGILVLGPARGQRPRGVVSKDCETKGEVVGVTRRSRISNPGR